MLSLEVGEHISNRYEGMFIRNLHRHNCQGIILSWGVLGQQGHHHVNNHKNEYIEEIFRNLGYTRELDWEAKFRNPDGNYDWFKSVMVFRRKTKVC